MGNHTPGRHDRAGWEWRGEVTAILGLNAQAADGQGKENPGDSPVPPINLTTTA